MVAQKSQKVETPPQEVYKQEELDQFIEFVASGLWKNNRFLGELLGVSDETIAAWKKRPEVIQARRNVTRGTLKRWQRQADPEKILKEQGMDFDAEKVDVSMKIEVKGLENL